MFVVHLSYSRNVGFFSAPSNGYVHLLAESDACVVL